LEGESYKYITGMDFAFDFDCDDVNSNESYLEAEKMHLLLMKKRLPHEISFSGSK